MDIDDNKIRQLDLKLLLILRDVIREGRTTLAAKRLGLSQSAVSHALTRLRAIFGDPLFTRRPDGLEPTARSIELLPKIEALIELARDAVGTPAVFDPATSRRAFRLVGNDFAAALVAAPLAGDLRETAPRARLAFRSAVGGESLDLLRRNAADLAVGTFLSVPEGFIASRLCTESFLVIARQGHERLRGGLDLESYVALDHLLVSFKGAFTGRVDQSLQRQGLSRRVAASVPMFFAGFAAVAASDLIAAVPGRLANRYGRAFGLDVFECPFEIEPFEVLALRHVRSAHDPGLDWLIARIAALVA